MQDLQSMYRKLQKDEMIRNRCESIVNMFLDQRMTIRLCAENLCVSKSTVHTDIHHRIKYMYPAEYREICKKLAWNSKYLCVNRKYWK